jgi:hypothetical protein
MSSPWGRRSWSGPTSHEPLGERRILVRTVDFVKRLLDGLILLLAFGLVAGGVLTGGVHLPVDHLLWGSRHYPIWVGGGLLIGALGLFRAALAGKLHLPGLLAWAWLIALGWGLLHPVDRWDALLYVGMAGAGWALYLGLSQVETARLGLILFAALGAFEGGLALVQELSHLPTPRYWLSASLGAYFTRAPGTLVNPNYLAGFLLLTLGATLALWRPPWRALVSFALLLQLGGLIVTFSRGGYFGLGVGWLYALWSLPRWRKHLLLGGLTVLLVALLVPRVNERLLSLTHPQHTAAASRLFLWTTALRIWETQPWLGQGWGAYDQLYPLYRPPGAQGTYALINPPGGAHNDYLELLVDVGLVASGLLLLGGLAQRRELLPFDPLIAAALALGGESLSESNLLVPALYFSFCWLWALRPRRAFRPLSGWGRALLVVPAALCLIPLWCLPIPTQTFAAEAEAQQLLPAQPQQAIALLQVAEQKAPWDANLPLWVGEAWIREAQLSRFPWRSPDWAKARLALRRASALDPPWSRPYALLSVTEEAQHHNRLALEAQLQAVRRDPYNPYLWVHLAELELEEDQLSQACQALLEARGLFPWQELALTHHQAPLAQQAIVRRALARVDALLKRAGPCHPLPLGQPPR